MNQTEARKLWVEALRSGEYEQTDGALRYEDKFCCLGVACDLYRKHGGGPEWGPNDVYDAKVDYLPKSVMDWLGVSHDSGVFGEGDDMDSLGDLNDAGTGFEVIAEIIESEPEGLFIPCTS